MQVACVLIDHFPFKLELGWDPGLEKHKVIIFRRDGSRRTVMDASPAVRQVTPGMPLQEAIAGHREAVLVEANAARYEQEFNNVLLRLGERSPVVQASGLGCAYVGLNGLADTYGSEERLIELLLQAVPQQLRPRLGVGEGRFPAYLAALHAGPGRAYRSPREMGQFIAPFPVDVLPVPWAVKARLHSFGLDTLGNIASLPLGPFQAQFGKMGTEIWWLAQGVDDTPLLPQRREESVMESLTFPAPTAHLEPLLLAVDSLLGRLFARPEMRGRYTRLALLKGNVSSKPAWERRIVFKTPVGDRRRAYLVIKGSLENVALPGLLEDMRVTLKELVGEAGLQESLFREVRRREQLRQTIAQLKVSQGRNPIYQVREVEPWSRIPERRLALVTYDP